jgi:hypothetical protein
VDVTLLFHYLQLTILYDLAINMKVS